MIGRKISVSDVTIKIAESDPGSPLSFKGKIELAKLLDKLGVSVIETGAIKNGRSDSLLVKSLALAISGSTLAVPVDISEPESIENTWEALKGARKPRLQVCAPVSTVQMEYLCHKKPEAIIETISVLISKCKALCPDVEFIADDFNRSEKDFVAKVVSAAVEAGATTVTVRDTAGNLLPDEFDNYIREVRNIIPANVNLGVWCSNEMSMADSCAITAVRAGADEIKMTSYDNSTVSLKRFAKILKAKEDVCNAHCDIQTTEIQRITEQIKVICETKKSKTVSSSAKASSDELSGIKLSRHDDMAAVMKAVSKLGYELSEDDKAQVYETFLRLAAKDEVVEAKELDAIVASAAFQVPPTYKLESYVINSGNLISATCHLKLRKKDQLLESVCLGDGPVDAAFHAIEKLVDRQYELDDFQIQSVTEGREAMGEAVVRLRCEGRLFSGRGLSTDIVGSGIMAYLNAVNKIEYGEGQA